MKKSLILFLFYCVFASNSIAGQRVEILLNDSLFNKTDTMVVLNPTKFDIWIYTEKNLLIGASKARDTTVSTKIYEKFGRKSDLLEKAKIDSLLADLKNFTAAGRNKTQAVPKSEVDENIKKEKKEAREKRKKIAEVMSSRILITPKIVFSFSYTPYKEPERVILYTSPENAKKNEEWKYIRLKISGAKKNAIEYKIPIF
ncbi:MAG: hypothetical protein HYW78_02075 [Parcubacteria group bacterium]|nr:hypothetical protein [Parcubacteria group bacterium]